MTADFRDVYQAVTDEILAALERGVRPWARSWKTETSNGSGTLQLPRRSTGELYRGVNVILLWCAAAKGGYRNVYWFTFKQAQALGASVRKGEKATRVLFFDRITREDSHGEETTIPFARTYAVFNADQISGLPQQFEPSNTGAPEMPVAGMPAAAFFAAMGADVRQGPQPVYIPLPDCIEMPRIDDFVTPDAYVATLAHELVHWTGHPSRLDREFKRQGTDAYAVEELVAELGAAFLCGSLGVASGEREDHAAYLSSYLRVLRNDKRVLVRAASAAQKAVDFLHQRAGASKAEAAAA